MGRPPNPIPNVRRIFTLRPSDVEMLARLREALNLPSEAAVVRWLIRDAARKVER